MRLWMVIVPCDYSTADAQVFRTEAEAEAYKAEEAQSRCDGDHYIIITEVEV